MSDTPTSAPKAKQNAFSWSMTREELQDQVENYHILPFAETARGAAIIFVLCMLGLSVVLAAFGVIPLDSSTVIEWLLYLISLYFIYRGHRWAIVTVMLLWTGDKAYQFYQISSSGQGSAIMTIFWWFLVMPYLYKALKVENARGATPAGATVKSRMFCSHCGSQQEPDAKFCTACGKQI